MPTTSQSADCNPAEKAPYMPPPPRDGPQVLVSVRGVDTVFAM